MSFGKTDSQSQSQSQQQANSQQSIDPGILAADNANLQRAQGVANTPATPYSGVLAAPVASQIGAATTAAQNLTGFQAPTITAGQLSNTDLTPYENPYSSGVIDTTNADLSRQNQIDNANAAAKATASGAFGGSRSAVLQNQNTDSYQRAVAATDAGLRQANFTQAQGAASTDIANQLGAAKANQDATVSGANVQQGAAGLLGSLGQTVMSNTNAGLQNLYQEFLRMQQYPGQMQQLLNQSLGLLPNPVLSSSQSTGSSSGSGSASGFNISAPKAG